jgi:hypothetical protein
MKKILYIGILSFFLGCATNTANIDKEIKDVQTENQILKKYQVSKESLVKANGNYFFYQPVNDGISIYKLDKNYNISQAKKINKLIDVTKIKSDGKNIYILGYDQQKNSPVLVELSSDLKIKKLKYFAYKYDIPKDMIIDKTPVIILIHYKNGANLEICKDYKCKYYKEKYNTLPKFINKFNGGYLITGSIQHPKEDLLILFVKNGKIVWSKIYDFGMEDSPYKVTVQNNKATIKLVSQDYMGAEKYITIEIDKNGNIINHKKDLEFKQLPIKFRT